MARSHRSVGGFIDGAKQAPWWAVCLLIAVLGAPVAAEASEPKIVISPLVRAEVSTVLDFSLRIDSANPPPVGSFIIITGLPASVTFSAGSAAGTGVWEVPLAALDGLKMVVPDGGPSRSALILFLATKKKDLVILDSALSFLVIEAPTEDARRQATAKKVEDERLAEVRRAEEAKKAEEAKAEEARRQAAAKKVEDERLAEVRRAEEAKKVEEIKAEEARRQAAAKKVEDERLAEVRRAEEAKKAEKGKAEDARRQAGVARVDQSTTADAALPVPTAAPSQRLIARGDEQVDLGNILLARQYFLRAAQAGLAAAAFKLAETHDPHELARLNVHGPMPDLAEAKRWYARARDLGAAEAEARLGRLGD